LSTEALGTDQNGNPVYLKDIWPSTKEISDTIIATIGPACADVAILAEMIRSGMSVARMNFSHGDYAFHTRMADLVREASLVAGKPAALLADLQGAKVRVGRPERGGAGSLRTVAQAFLCGNYCCCC